MQFIALYGSSLKERSKLSDIDLAVYFDGTREERFYFRAIASGELSDKFDVQIFQDLPLYMRGEVVKNGKLLHYKDYDFLFDVCLETIRAYEGFEKYLKLYYSSLEEEVSAGS
ncbi:MAG TPA: nucleotidyltransferase domain-containing protein [Hadesarchaea archaeon]|nr:nucleotidyltransferase domain-containing protein [Hadesarchaea archaeon]